MLNLSRPLGPKISPNFLSSLLHRTSNHSFLLAVISIFFELISHDKLTLLQLLLLLYELCINASSVQLYARPRSPAAVKSETALLLHSCLLFFFAHLPIPPMNHIIMTLPAIIFITKRSAHIYSSLYDLSLLLLLQLYSPPQHYRQHLSQQPSLDMKLPCAKQPCGKIECPGIDFTEKPIQRSFSCMQKISKTPLVVTMHLLVLFINMIPSFHLHVIT